MRNKQPSVYCERLQFDSTHSGIMNCTSGPCATQIHTLPLFVTGSLENRPSSCGSCHTASARSNLQLYFLLFKGEGAARQLMVLRNMTTRRWLRVVCKGAKQTRALKTKKKKTRIKNCYISPAQIVVSYITTSRVEGVTVRWLQRVSFLFKLNQKLLLKMKQNEGRQDATFCFSIYRHSSKATAS